MDGSILVPIAFFAMIAAIVLVPKILRSREREQLHETLRMAYEKGQPVPPELIDSLQPSKSETFEPVVYREGGERDLRRGVIWVAVGLGLIAIGVCFYAGLYYVGGASETLMSFAAAGVVPLFIGLAFLGLWFFGRRRPS